MFAHLSIFYGWVRIHDPVEKTWMFVFIYRVVMNLYGIDSVFSIGRSKKRIHNK